MEEKEILTLSPYDNFMYALKQKPPNVNIQIDSIDFSPSLDSRGLFKKNATGF